VRTAAFYDTLKLQFLSQILQREEQTPYQELGYYANVCIRKVLTVGGGALYRFYGFGSRGYCRAFPNPLSPEK